MSTFEPAVWVAPPMIRRAAATLIALAMTLIAALSFTACSGKDAGGSSATGDYRFNGATAKGEAIPIADRKAIGQVSADLLTGGTFDFASLSGKVALINFYASWCTPCQTETPQLVALDEEIKQDKNLADKVAFVGVATKESSMSSATSFVADMKIDYTVVNDRDARVPLLIGNIPMRGLPETIILDKQHRVAAVYSTPVLPADLRPVLTRLASET